MQLTVWTYEGPPHVGAMRIATAMRGRALRAARAAGRHLRRPAVHHDRAARPKRPPVTYTTFQARDLGSDTAELFKNAARDAYERFKPQALLVGASCTAELIQDDPGGLARALGLPIPVVPLELPAYQKKENWGAAETFYQLVRACARPPPSRARTRAAAKRRRCNILGPTALGFRHRDDLAEIDALLERLGVASMSSRRSARRRPTCARLGDADFNVVLYPEIARPRRALARSATFEQPLRQDRSRSASARRATSSREVAELAGVDPAAVLRAKTSRLPWYSRSVDSTYLTGKRVFIFGDATHAIAAARVAPRGAGLHGRRPRHLQPRVRARSPRGGRAATASRR